MLSYEQALTALLAAARPVTGAEEADTVDACGRVLAQSQISAVDVPALDNSSMDGYAVRCADVAFTGARLRVAQRIPAGSVGMPLAAGTAARIFTGAPVPDGADAIVMQELCERAGDEVTINHVPHAGEWIRRAGEDIRAGSELLAGGRRLKPQDVGLAASVGLARLPLMRRIKVAVFFTGDELVMPGQPLPPGGVYNSNRFLLRALLQQLGCETTDFGIVPDRLDATRAVLREAAAAHDLIVTSGGVSVGDEDHVRPAVQAEGELDLWKIALKPGKPLAFGRVGPAAFIGLPGNPVSGFVTFLLLVRPFILRMQGVHDVAPPVLTLRADFDWTRPDQRREFLRVRRNNEGGLDVFPNQSAGVLTSTSWGDGLVDNPSAHAIARGDLVRFLPFCELLH